MFVQVIKGRTRDAAALRRQGEIWVEQVRPGAVGFLGCTTGVSDDGTLISLARFESAEAAAANSARPEQTAWWEQTAKLLDGEATFLESSDVSLLFDGGSDAAGFVQIMEGRVANRAKAEAFETDEVLAELRAARPDLLGGIRVWFDGDAFVEAAYFTSEADARRGESSADFSGPQADYAALYGETTYVDLKDPQLIGAA